MEYQISRNVSPNKRFGKRQTLSLRRKKNENLTVKSTRSLKNLSPSVIHENNTSPNEIPSTLNNELLSPNSEIEFVSFCMYKTSSVLTINFPNLDMSDLKLHLENGKLIVIVIREIENFPTIHHSTYFYSVNVSELLSLDLLTTTYINDKLIVTFPTKIPKWFV
tara:strand:+ start:196 stop:687 length:492 start_codon:yes stop_codon:yes gene_type:complete